MRQDATVPAGSSQNLNLPNGSNGYRTWRQDVGSYEGPKRSRNLPGRIMAELRLEFTVFTGYGVGRICIASADGCCLGEALLQIGDIIARLGECEVEIREWSP